MLKIWIVLLVILAITSLGCMDSDKTEGTVKIDDVKVEYSVSEDSEDKWCPVGSTFKMSDPSSGDMASWEVVGTEDIDGIEMCKWVMETTDEDGESFRMEMYHSEDDNIVITITYDSSGNLVSKMTMKDDSMIVEDGEGNIISEINQ